MSQVFAFPFDSIDLLVIFGLALAAFACGWHVHSHQSHHEHDQKHGEKSGWNAVPVWVEWAFGLVFAVVFLGAAAGFVLQA